MRTDDGGRAIRTLSTCRGGRSEARTLLTTTTSSAYGVGMVMPVRVVPTFWNRAVRSFPSACAPTAMARATKTRSIAYSVAVAPASSLPKRLIRGSIRRSFSRGLACGQWAPKRSQFAAEPRGRLTVLLSAHCPGQRQKTAFSNFFNKLRATEPGVARSLMEGCGRVYLRGRGQTWWTMVGSAWGASG